MADAQHTIGELLDEPSDRDAVHIAMAPVLAAQELLPGQHVGLIECPGCNGSKGNPPFQCAICHGELRAGPCDDNLGIVDPYLVEPVRIGKRFWLFLYPNTITSLNHIWQHPAFDKELALRVDVVAERLTGTSEAWLREFCAAADCPGYDDVIAATQGINIHAGNDDHGYSGYWKIYNDGEYLFFGGRDAHGHIPPEFWDHVEIVTGKKFGPDQRATHFTCSC